MSRPKTSSRQPSRSRQSPVRLILLGILGVVAVGVIIFAVSQSAKPAAANSSADLQSMADGLALGSTSAPVTIQEFADFQCPYCLQFHNTIEGPLLQQYVATGKARFEYHHFIIIDSHTGGNQSERAAEASECANAQGKFWGYHDTLFAHQGGEGSSAFSDDNLIAFAQNLGLNMPEFTQCLTSGQFGTVVQADVLKGLSLGVQGTPTVFVNGVEATDPFDFSGLQSMIQTALAKAQ